MSSFEGFEELRRRAPHSAQRQLITSVRNRNSGFGGAATEAMLRAHDALDRASALDRRLSPHTRRTLERLNTPHVRRLMEAAERARPFQSTTLDYHVTINAPLDVSGFDGGELSEDATGEVEEYDSEDN